jgi:transposase InsO family protein
MSRSSLGYRSKKNDITIIEQLQKLASDHPREGFWKSYYRLRNKGEQVNHKRLHRIYKQMGLPLRRKVKKRLPEREKNLCRSLPILRKHGALILCMMYFKMAENSATLMSLTILIGKFYLLNRTIRSKVAE